MAVIIDSHDALMLYLRQDALERMRMSSIADVPTDPEIKIQIVSVSFKKITITYIVKHNGNILWADTVYIPISQVDIVVLFTGIPTWL